MNCFKTKLQHAGYGLKRSIGAAALLLLSSVNSQAAVTPVAPENNGDTMLISSAANLFWLADYVNAGYDIPLNAVLTDDIVVSDASWTPIGKNAGKPFVGSFDGKGHSVSGLEANLASDGSNMMVLMGYYNDPKSVPMAGLFGFAQNSEIKNVVVENSYFSSNVGTGGIVGAADNTLIENCENKADVYGYNPIQRFGQAGGIVGVANNCKIVDCVNNGNVLVNADCVGGVAGYVRGSVVSSCSNYTSVYGSNYVGGVIGYVSDSSAVDKVLNFGSVYANQKDLNKTYGSSAKDLVMNAGKGQYGIEAGGIAGCVDSLSVLSNSLCLAKDVDGVNYIGAIVGIVKNNALVANCFSSAEISATGKFVDGVYAQSQKNGYATNCYSLAETQYGSQITAEDVENGFLCAQLNADSLVFYQNAGDPYPMFRSEDDLIDVEYMGGVVSVNPADALILDDENDYNTTVDKNVKIATYTRNITNNLGTLCLPFAFDTAHISSRVRLYTLGYVRDTAIKLVETVKVEAGQPVVFYAYDTDKPLYITSEYDELGNINVVSEPEVDQFLTGTFATETVVKEADSKFFLKDNKFMRGNQNFIAARFRAFIHKANVNNTLNSLGIEFDGTSDIEESVVDNSNLSVKAIYNLAGQVVANPVAGNTYVVLMSDGSVRKLILQ